jgi:hypothetical protein
MQETRLNSAAMCESALTLHPFLARLLEKGQVIRLRLEYERHRFGDLYHASAGSTMVAARSLSGFSDVLHLI